MNRGCPGSTTWPGRARTSVTRPVTGAFTRTAARVRTSGCTICTGFFGAPGAGAGWAICSDFESLHPDSSATRRRSRRGRMLTFQLAAHRGLEHVHRRAIVGEGAKIFEGLLAVAPLGVQVVEQVHPPAPVRELDGLARLLDLGQVVVAEERGLLALRGHAGQGGVDLGEGLGKEGIPRRLQALGLGLGPSDLALVPVEELDG